MSADEALTLMCQAHGLSLDVIRGPSKLTEDMRIRRWLATELGTAGFRQSEIARAMRRDHSSVHQWRRVDRYGHLPDVLCSCHFRGRLP